MQYVQKHALAYIQQFTSIEALLQIWVRGDLSTCLLQKNGQIYDDQVCHCVYPASRSFLNSFYTLGEEFKS